MAVKVESIAKEKLALRNEMRKKFGVTFSDRMDIETVLSQWKKVPASIKTANPEISAGMELLIVAQKSQDVAVTSASKAQSAYLKIRETVLASSAIMVGQFQLPVLKVASIGAETLVEKKIEITDKAKITLLQKLSSV